MNIWTILLRLWAALSVASLAIDGGCIWLDHNSAAAALLLDRYHVNYLTLFLWSAPAPFVVAVLVAAVGSVLAVLRWALQLGTPRLHLHHHHLHGWR